MNNGKVTELIQSSLLLCLLVNSITKMVSKKVALIYIYSITYTHARENQKLILLSILNYIMNNKLKKG